MKIWSTSEVLSYAWFRKFLNCIWLKGHNKGTVCLLLYFCSFHNLLLMSIIGDMLLWWLVLDRSSTKVLSWHLCPIGFLLCLILFEYPVHRNYYTYNLKRKSKQTSQLNWLQFYTVSICDKLQLLRLSLLISYRLSLYCRWTKAGDKNILW